MCGWEIAGIFISRINVKNKARFFIANIISFEWFQYFLSRSNFFVYHSSTGLLFLMQTSANFPPGCRKNLRFFKTLATYVWQSKVDVSQLKTFYRDPASDSNIQPQVIFNTRKEIQFTIIPLQMKCSSSIKLANPTNRSD